MFYSVQWFLTIMQKSLIVIAHYTTQLQNEDGWLVLSAVTEHAVFIFLNDI